MPTAAGLLLSTLMGALARRFQVTLIGKNYEKGFDRLFGYALSSGAFVGGYLVVDHYVEGNKQLLQRRLAVLREQRAQKAIFHEFENEPDHRSTGDKRSVFFKFMDTHGAPYK